MVRIKQAYNAAKQTYHTSKRAYRRVKDFDHRYQISRKTARATKYAGKQAIKYTGKAAKLFFKQIVVPSFNYLKQKVNDHFDQRSLPNRQIQIQNQEQYQAYNQIFENSFEHQAVNPIAYQQPSPISYPQVPNIDQQLPFNPQTQYFNQQFPGQNYAAPLPLPIILPKFPSPIQQRQVSPAQVQAQPKPGEIQEKFKNLSYVKEYQREIEREVIQQFQEFNTKCNHVELQKRKLLFIKTVLEKEKNALSILSEINREPKTDLIQHLLSLSKGLGIPEEEVRTCIIVSGIAARVRQTEGFPPRMNQILSTLLFLDGDMASFAQIQTGQGKTLIAAMTAIARKKLYGEKVCVLTTTEPLASSGVNEMRRLYESCGLSVGYFNGAGFPQGQPPGGGFDVVYATPFGIESDKISMKKGMGSKLNIWNIDNLCFIVDECDSVLFDHAANRIQSTIQMPYPEKIKFISAWIARDTQAFYSKPRSSKRRFETELKQQIIADIMKEKDPSLQNYVLGELDQWVKDALDVMNPDDPNWQNGVNYLEETSITHDMVKMLNELKVINQRGTYNKIFSEGVGLLNYFISSAEQNRKIQSNDPRLKKLLPYMRKLPNELRRSEVFQSLYQKIAKINLNEHSIQKALFEGQIRYIEGETAQIIEKMKFGKLIHQFLEYKAFGKVFTEPTTALNLQSQIDTLRSARCVIGFSGTLPNKTLNKREYKHFKKLSKEIYNKGRKASMWTIPEFTLNKRTQDSEQVIENRDRWERAILEKIEEKKKKNQAILIICKNPKECLEMKEFLSNNHLQARMYAHAGDQNVIDHTYGVGEIVISTPLGSRGTDWHVNAQGGFHVLCTYFPSNPRITSQIAGRSARSGQEGSFGIISREKRINLPDQIRAINANIRQACYNDLLSYFYRMFECVIDVKMGRKEGSKRTERNQIIQNQLILWMSMTQTQSDILKAIQEATRNDYRRLNAILQNFCNRFEIHPQHLTPKFYSEIQNWVNATSRVLAATA